MSQPPAPSRPFGTENLTEEHRRHLFEGEPDEDLVQGLEPDQLVAVMEMQLPRARVGTAVNASLWVLRILLLLLAAMAIISFVAGLHNG